MRLALAPSLAATLVAALAFSGCSGGSDDDDPGVCVAQTETCNGADDDCDGETDEDLGTVSCGTGVCAREVAACVDGEEGACTPGTGTEETCNGLDDDCDGQVDDLTTEPDCAAMFGYVGLCADPGFYTYTCDGEAGIVCTTTVRPETMTEYCGNGIDDDCDHATDEEGCTTP